ncbi:MAG TPA: hypothetical protein VMI31_10805 [Fimbriimonadaceae bacterium]|nr:hypothetical protein [Fimbriimonadaceae bacterium]
MQVPPEQPIGPGGYPRPVNYNAPERFVADLVLGILLIIGSICGGFLALGMTVLGGVTTAIGGAAASQPGGLQTAGVGTGVMVVGILILLACIGQLVGAIWMLQSLEKGLRMVMVIGIAGLVLNIVLGVMLGHFNFVGAGVGLLYPIYCGLRLSGNLGPKPVT